ncbi:sigma-70 family RNA polymerase sigma factor [Amycolatopsis sp. NPDC047767]|uniref:RNA polymerase sigma factor n=1 Tax=Amycolatopsis sp. NPDC047767 TaxID=3156765 RepID=UPI00345272B5
MPREAELAGPSACRAIPPLGGEEVGRIGIPVELLPDETLLAGLATGEAEIAVAFVRRFQRTVYGVGIAVLGDSRLAEDVAQLTFERAWRHAEIYDARRGSVRTWLTAIAHNLAIDMVRAHQPTPLDPGDLAAQFTAVVDSPERLAAAHEDASALQTGLTALPVPQARALVMAGIYGMTAQQIADTEHIPLGTAKTRIRSAMRKLRGSLAAERVDHG